MSTAALFVGSLVIIVVAAELFTNAVEWAGFRLRLGSGATGSLLAAFGTALPETIVPIVALFSGAPNREEVAQGAVLGSSFLLLTLGVAVTGIAVLARSGESLLVIEPGQARRDLGVFLICFSLAILCVALPSGMRIPIGVLLLVVYGAYVVMTLRGGEPAEELPEPLHLTRWRDGEPWVLAIVIQLVAAVVLLILGSHLFVDALDNASQALGVSALVLAVILVPFATELPETFNSVLWVRTRDDGLAFGNVAGAAAFQASILGFIGVEFTTWNPGLGGLLSAAAAWVTAVYLFFLLHDGRAHGRWLLLAGVPWVAYVVAELATGGGLA